jgi:hypothetical protein
MEKILFAIDSAKTAVEAKTLINAKAWLEEALILVAAAQQRIHQTCPKCGANFQSGTTPKDGATHCPQCGASW